MLFIRVWLLDAFINVSTSAFLYNKLESGLNGQSVAVRSNTSEIIK